MRDVLVLQRHILGRVVPTVMGSTATVTRVIIRAAARVEVPRDGPPLGGPFRRQDARQQQAPGAAAAEQNARTTTDRDVERGSQRRAGKRLQLQLPHRVLARVAGHQHKRGRRVLPVRASGRRA